MTVYALQGDTVDAICWRFYGQTTGHVERVLKENPGLADLGAVLSAGTVIVLSETPLLPATPLVQLWD